MGENKFGAFMQNSELTDGDGQERMRQEKEGQVSPIKGEFVGPSIKETEERMGSDALGPNCHL